MVAFLRNTFVFLYISNYLQYRDNNIKKQKEYFEDIFKVNLSCYPNL